jgi:hypothetical protein
MIAVHRAPGAIRKGATITPFHGHTAGLTAFVGSFHNSRFRIFLIYKILPNNEQLLVIVSDFLEYYNVVGQNLPYLRFLSAFF